MKRVLVIMFMALVMPVGLMAQVRVNNMTIGRDGYIEQYGWKIKIKNNNNVWINDHKIDGKVDVIVYNRDKIKVNGRDITDEVSSRVSPDDKTVSNIVINGRNLDDVIDGFLSKASSTSGKKGWCEIREKVIAKAIEKGIDEITCDQKVLAVKVVPTDEDCVSVEAYIGYLKVNKSDYGIGIAREGSRLTIWQKGGATSFQGSPSSKGNVITIKVPRTMIHAINIANTSGSISVFGVDASYIKCTSVSGAIAVSNAKVNKALTLQSTSGSITMEKVEGNVLMQATSISGGVVVKGTQCDKLNATTTSGSIYIDGIDTGLLIVRSISGDVKAFAISKSLKDMSVKTTSGDIRLSLPKNVEKSYTYNMTSVSGAIRVGSITAYKSLSIRTDDGHANIHCASVSGSITVIQGTSGIVK